MAYETGTATDHVDLYNRLYTFLTSHIDLTGAGQEWTEAWAHPNASYPFSPGQEGSDIVLKGPGTAGLDEIYVGMRLVEDPQDDRYGIWFSGCQGLVTSNLAFDDHFNSCPAMHVPLFDQATPYWFVGNGRRFVVVAKISTTFVACYQGLFLPYATPSEYPYPLVSSGCNGTDMRWSDESPAHRHFCMPYDDDISTYDNIPYGIPGSPVSAVQDGRLHALSPAGEWVSFSNRRNDTFVWPWRRVGATPDFVTTQQTLLGGGHMLTPATLMGHHTRLQGTLGVLEGVYHAPGFGNAAENLVTIGGVDHLVVQNMFRTGFTDYWALRLE